MHKTVRGWLLDLLADLGGGLLYAVGIDTFARTADFAPGGISGLALIADHLWGLPVGLMSLVFNVPVVLLSFRLLGRRFLLRSLRSMLACTVFMDWVLPAAVTPYGGSPCSRRCIRAPAWGRAWPCFICVARPRAAPIF